MQEQTIGARLQLAREAVSLHPAEVSRTYGISRTAILAYERNDSLPGSKAIIVFCEAYGIEPGWLLGIPKRRKARRQRR